MPDETPEFEMGLVMAGAVSAGAYSAGVMDFITEALDAYEIARTTGRTAEGEVWDGPTHSVRVPVIAGASAGGMTAAITSLCWFTDLTHVGPGEPPGPEANRLYASWVDEIDIDPLLDPGGLDNGVLSVLNCHVMGPGSIVRKKQYPSASVIVRPQLPRFGSSGAGQRSLTCRSRPAALACRNSTGAFGTGRPFASR